jgi:hypothetical protein
VRVEVAVGSIALHNAAYAEVVRGRGIGAASAVMGIAVGAINDEKVNMRVKIYKDIFFSVFVFVIFTTF